MSAQNSKVSLTSLNAQDAVSATYQMTATGSRYEAAPTVVPDGQIRGVQIDSQGRQVVIGPTADANTFINRPVGVGGIYRSTLPTYTDGQATIFHMSNKGRLLVQDDALTALVPASLGQKAMAASLAVVIASDQSAFPVKLQDGAGSAVNKGQGAMAASLPVAIASDQSTLNVAVTSDTVGTANGVLIGPVTETAPATDTASSGLNGRLQRIAQRLTSFMALFPGSLGQKTMANSLAVTLASDQSAQTAIGGTQTTTGTVSSAIDVFASTDVSAYGMITLQLVITGTATVTFRGSNDNVNFRDVSLASSAGSGACSTVTGSSSMWFGGAQWKYFKAVVTSYTNGSITGTMVAMQGSGQDPGLRTISVSNTVNVAQSGTWTMQPGNTANTTAWLTAEERVSTATLTNVASSASSVSLLASTAGRKHATFFNDSTQVLYLKFGATASTSSYTVQLAAGGYYELPSGRIYTGAIDGIWASANGNARITELT